MHQIITAKIKLQTTPEQRQLLRQTQLAYRAALNYVSQYAFAHGKMSNIERLQQGTYDDIRLLYRLPSQMACNVPRQVAATYKGLWTKLRKNLEHRKAGYTKKRYKAVSLSLTRVMSRMWRSSATVLLLEPPSSGTTKPTSSFISWSHWNWRCLSKPLTGCLPW